MTKVETAPNVRSIYSFEELVNGYKTRLNTIKHYQIVV